MNKIFSARAILVLVATMFAYQPAWSQEMNLMTYGLQLEELEFRKGEDNTDQFVWNGDAYVGTDELKLRWLSEGEYDVDAKSFEGLENQFVLQTPISTFFDVKGGVRFDTPDGPDRTYGVVGLTGLAPQWFELDLDLFLSEKGDSSARLDVEYEVLITNRLILTTSADLNFAFADDREIGIGSGMSGVEAGMRLSYDVVDRRLSPYIGIVYDRLLGKTADIARDENEDIGGWRLVVGTKFVF